ncbi:hypothetical protein [uncultured Lamprocystis sp.]|jgi:hypothetical protein|uniref:hypothetical protein n=2 Tax=uncultured Lamprocystis sp. TaxID=543132 RepID=UPI0025CBA034|nr:hypothetical protein [uncultured Lamprocystis sp.]
MPTTSAPTADLNETLRQLDAATLYLANDLNAEDEGRDSTTPQYRAAMADLVRALARQARDEYEVEAEWHRTTADGATDARPLDLCDVAHDTAAQLRLLSHIEAGDVSGSAALGMSAILGRLADDLDTAAAEVQP